MSWTCTPRSRSELEPSSVLTTACAERLTEPQDTRTEQGQARASLGQAAQPLSAVLCSGATDQSHRAGQAR